MFNKILIANRGEIACRIIRTCKRMGIRTVAVYSQADQFAQHVIQADEAHLIGGPRPVDSYLKGDAIIEMAKKPPPASAVAPFLPSQGDVRPSAQAECARVALDQRSAHLKAHVVKINVA